MTQIQQRKEGSAQGTGRGKFEVFEWAQVQSPSWVLNKWYPGKELLYHVMTFDWHVREGGRNRLSKENGLDGCWEGLETVCLSLSED